jgi:hypothetical protein
MMKMRLQNGGAPMSAFMGKKVNCNISTTTGIGMVRMEAVLSIRFFSFTYGHQSVFF